MKTACSTHGAHFPDEYKKTLTKACNFWADRGLAALPAKYKKQVWDWMFGVNLDEIYSKGRHKLEISLIGRKVAKPKVFADIPEYAKMSEGQRRRFQRIAAQAKKMEIL